MTVATVRILMLEDRDDDALLVERELRRTGIAFEAARARDRSTFLGLLESFKPDLILSDHNLAPDFNGTEALRIAREVASAVPFIFVSGTIGEENAIEALQRGATDYVIKDRLTRLVPVVKRALAEAEERRTRLRLEREFLQAQKMESLGRMAGAIAHDFNNLLVVMCGRAELLLGDGALPEAMRASAASILKAGQQGRDLTQRLLAFSRGHVGTPVRFDLNARLTEFEPVFASALGKSVELSVRSAGTPLPLRGDPSQVDQLVMNLIVNARDAMPDGGRLVCETERVDAPDGPPAGFPLAPPGAYARLTMTDTGTGMTAEVKARLFEPFFTTKPPGRGTGLGMATVYAIVQAFGGAISVTSEPGAGTSFGILLPLADASEPRAEPDRRTVLLVDDEEHVRGMVREVLLASGFAVREVGNGAEALAALNAEPGRYSLVVTDVMMPGMDGVELARRLRAAGRDVPIVFLSGAAGALREAEAALAGTVSVEKPFRTSEFIKVVRAAHARTG